MAQQDPKLTPAATASSATAVSPRLVRDRYTWALYAFFAVYGFAIYCVSPAVALLRDEHGTSATVSGLHGLGMAVGTIAGGLLGLRLTRLFGRARLIVLSMTALAGTLVLFAAAPSPLVSIPALGLISFFGALQLNAAIAALSDRHKALSAAAISESNALGAWVGLIAPSVLGIAIAVGVGWRAPMLALVPVCLLLVWWARPVLIDGSAGPAVQASARRPFRRQFHAAVFVVFTGIASEFCLTLWGSTLLRDDKGLGVAAATSAMSVLLLGLAVGRTGGSWLAQRFAAGPLLTGAFVVAMLGFWVMWLSPISWASIVGLGIVGLGLSLLFPIGSARAIALSGGQPDAATARLGVVAGAGIGLAPFALGMLVEAFDVKGAFLVLPVLLLLGVLANLAILRSDVHTLNAATATA